MDIVSQMTDTPERYWPHTKLGNIQILLSNPISSLGQRTYTGAVHFGKLSHRLESDIWRELYEFLTS